MQRRWPTAPACATQLAYVWAFGSYKRNLRERSIANCRGCRRLSPAASQCAALALCTSVLQIRRNCDHLARVTGDGTQVLVDCSEVMVGHVLEEWPSHDLKKIAVESAYAAQLNSSRSPARGF